MERIVLLVMSAILMSGCITLRDNGQGKYELGVTTETSETPAEPEEPQEPKEPAPPVTQEPEPQRAEVAETKPATVAVKKVATSAPVIVPPPAPVFTIEKLMADEFDAKSMKVIAEWEDGLSLVFNVERDTDPAVSLVAFADGTHTTVPIFEDMLMGSCEGIDAQGYMLAPGLLALQFLCTSSGDNFYQNNMVVIFEFTEKPTSSSMIRQRWAGQGSSSSQGYYGDDSTSVTFRVDGDKVIADSEARSGNDTGEAQTEAAANGEKFVPRADTFTRSSEVLFERQR